MESDNPTTPEQPGQTAIDSGLILDFIHLHAVTRPLGC